MAQITSTYTVTTKCRDNGKVFHLTEMAARPAHRWASRLLFAALNAGVEIPDDMMDAGMAGLATMGFKAVGSIPFDVAEPLLDELLACVTIEPDPVAHPGNTRKLYPTDIEEATTFFKLQKAVWSLHLEPFMRGVESTSASDSTPDPAT